MVSLHNKRHINLLVSGLHTLVFANHHRYLKYARRIRAVYQYGMAQQRCDVYAIIEIPRLLIPMRAFCIKIRD